MEHAIKLGMFPFSQVQISRAAYNLPVCLLLRPVSGLHHKDIVGPSSRGMWFGQGWEALPYTGVLFVSFICFFVIFLLFFEMLVILGDHRSIHFLALKLAISALYLRSLSKKGLINHVACPVEAKLLLSNISWYMSVLNLPQVSNSVSLSEVKDTV